MIFFVILSILNKRIYSLFETNVQFITHTLYRIFLEHIFQLILSQEISLFTFLTKPNTNY